MKGHKDDNDRLRERTLPIDPAADATPMESPNTDAGAWEAPVHLDNQVELPRFPVEILPGWARRWVTAMTTALQCPLDLPAMLLIAVISLATAKKFAVRVRPGWTEPINIYVVVGLPPGESKTPAFTAAIAPVERFEAVERKRLKPEIESALMHYDIATKRLESLKARAAKETEPTERAKLKDEAEEALLERSLLKIPVAVRYLADDITSEKLVEVMLQQGGRIGIFSDEGGPFDLMSGRYTDGSPNFDVYLKGHSGSAIITDRIGREGGSIKSPAIVMGLAVQPAVVAGLGQKKGFRGKGLLARNLYALPTSTVGRRAPDSAPVAETIREDYEKHVTALLRIEPDRDDDREIKPTLIPLSMEAYAILVRFKAALEPRLAPDGDLHRVADWANKLAGESLRIAGLLHLADRAGTDADPAAESIDAETMARAACLADYQIDHALAAFEMMEGDPVAALARIVVAWIRRRGNATFDRRHAYLECRPHFKAPEEIDPILQLLGEHGYIRPSQQPARSGAGRPASPVFEVNPAVLAQNTQNAQNPVSSTLELNSEYSERDFGRVEAHSPTPVIPSGGGQPSERSPLPFSPPPDSARRPRIPSERRDDHRTALPNDFVTSPSEVSSND